MRSAAVPEQDPQARLRVGPLADHEVARERVGTDDPTTGDVGDELGPRRRIGPVAVGRRRQDPEVDGVVVRVHDQHVAPVIDAVLDVVAAWSHEHGCRGRVVGRDEPHLAARLARRLDDDEVVGPRLADPDEVALVGLLEHSVSSPVADSSWRQTRYGRS